MSIHSGAFKMTHLIHSKIKGYPMHTVSNVVYSLIRAEFENNIHYDVDNKIIHNMRLQVWDNVVVNVRNFVYRKVCDQT